LAYDLTNDDSFNQLKDDFLVATEEHAKNRLKFIVGCKSDLTDKITVKSEKPQVKFNIKYRN
jgi:hypothetical protein